MRKRNNAIGLLAGLGLMITIIGSAFSVHAQSRQIVADSPFIQSTKDYFEAEQLIDAIADELYKAYQLYPEFDYNIEYERDGQMTVIVSGVDNHTIANRIAKQILVLEDIGRAISEIDAALLPEHAEMTTKDILNEQEAAAYQPDVDVSEGFLNVLNSH